MSEYTCYVIYLYVYMGNMYAAYVYLYMLILITDDRLPNFRDLYTVLLCI